MKGEGPEAYCRGHICRAIADRLSRRLRKLAREKKGGLADGVTKHVVRDVDTRPPARIGQDLLQVSGATFITHDCEVTLKSRMNR